MVVYDSRKLKTYEKNFPTHNLELAAAIFVLMLWHHYLYGVHSEIFANYHKLQYFSTSESKFESKEIN